MKDEKKWWVSNGQAKALQELVATAKDVVKTTTDRRSRIMLEGILYRLMRVDPAFIGRQSCSGQDAEK
jgi:hypothetical protein